MYKYNTDGIRVSKIVNGILHEYTLEGNIVVVNDTYNFDSEIEWDSFGNIMNNFAYFYHKNGGGNDFDWYAIYSYTTNWTRVH